MKNLIVLSALLLMGCAGVQAQNSFGIKGGLNLSSLVGDVNSTVKGRAALHAGVFMDIGLVDKLYLTPEVQFTSTGYKLNGVSGINNYISIPVMAKFNPIAGLYVEMGPQLGILVSAHEKSSTEKVSVSEAYNTIDFGLNFGAGYTLTDIGIGFGLRYNLGLSNVLKEASGIQNGVFQLSVFYQL